MRTDPEDVNKASESLPQSIYGWQHGGVKHKIPPFLMAAQRAICRISKSVCLGQPGTCDSNHFMGWLNSLTVSETIVIDLVILIKAVYVVAIDKDSTNKNSRQACCCIERGAWRPP
jgi:hypothetical protein